MKTIIGIIIMLALSNTSLANNGKLAFLSPASSKDIFWGPLERIALKAAKDLNIALDIYHGNRDKNEYFRNSKIIFRKKYDGIIITNHKDMASFILKDAKSNKTPVIIINQGINNIKSDDSTNLIAQIIPDDFKAGSELAEKLLNEVDFIDKEKIKFIALNGDLNDTSAVLRNSGLNKEIKKRGIKNIKYINANWNSHIAFENINRIIRNNNDIYYLVSK